MRRCVALLVLTAPLVASASYDLGYTVDSWPTRFIERPLTLGPTMFEIFGGGSKELSSGAGILTFQRSLQLLGGLRYGVDERRTVSVTDFAFCVSDCNGSLQSIAVGFSNVFVREPRFNVTGEALIALPSLSPEFEIALSGGARIQYQLSDQLQIWANPTLSLPLYEAAFHFRMDVEPRIQIDGRTVLIPRIGLHLPITGGALTEVPIGLGGVVTFGAIDLGADFTFTNVLGTDLGIVSIGPFDKRILRVFGMFRL